MGAGSKIFGLGVGSKALSDSKVSGAEVPLTFNTGLTRTGNTVKNDLITGKAGGQTVVGGTVAADSLIFKAYDGGPEILRLSDIDAAVRIQFTSDGAGGGTTASSLFLRGNSALQTYRASFNYTAIRISNLSDCGITFRQSNADTELFLGSSSQGMQLGTKDNPTDSRKVRWRVNIGGVECGKFYEDGRWFFSNSTDGPGAMLAISVSPGAIAGGVIGHKSSTTSVLGSNNQFLALTGLTVGNFAQLGFATNYIDANAPVTLGYEVTNAGGSGKGEWYVATRDVTTDTAPTKRLRIGAAGYFGFFGVSPVAQQTRGATLTNNVTSGGTDDTIADFAGVLYATDAATIRDDIYQLARIVRMHDVALRAYGLET